MLWQGALALLAQRDKLGQTTCIAALQQDVSFSELPPSGPG